MFIFLEETEGSSVQKVFDVFFTWNIGGFAHLPRAEKDHWVLVTAPGATSGGAPRMDSAVSLLVSTAHHIAHLITE